MIRRFLLLTIALCLWVIGLKAQNSSFTVSSMNIERDENLGGLGGLLVYSPHADIVVGVKPSICTAQIGGAVKKDGIYEYKIKVDISQVNDVTFTFSRKGSALQTELKRKLKKDHWSSCRVEEVANPIHCVDQTGRNFFSGKDGVAIVEFSSPISDLTVKPSDNLKCTVTKQPSATDASVTIIRVNIDGEALKKAKDEALIVAKEFSDLDSLLTLTDYKGTDDDWNRDEKLKEKSDQLTSLLEEMCVIQVFAPGSDVLYIDISDLGPKERRAFAVVPLHESYESLLANARKFLKEYSSHTESSYYDAARTAYDKVLEHADCPVDQREALRCERDTMASIRKYTYFVEETDRRAKKAEVEQGFESDEVFKNLSGEYKFINRLIAYHPEIEGLAAMSTNLWNRISKHPKAKEMVKETMTIQRQVVSGRVTLGNKNDFRPLNSLHVNVSMQQDVGKKDARQNSKQIGNVAADGTFSVIMPDGYHYLFIDGEKKAHHITPDTTTIDIEL